MSREKSKIRYVGANGGVHDTRAGAAKSTIGVKVIKAITGAKNDSIKKTKPCVSSDEEIDRALERVEKRLLAEQERISGLTPEEKEIERKKLYWEERKPCWDQWRNQEALKSARRQLN